MRLMRPPFFLSRSVSIFVHKAVVGSYHCRSVSHATSFFFIVGTHCTVFFSSGDCMIAVIRRVTCLVTSDPLDFIVSHRLNISHWRIYLN